MTYKKGMLNKVYTWFLGFSSCLLLLAAVSLLYNIQNTPKESHSTDIVNTCVTTAIQAIKNDIPEYSPEEMLQPKPEPRYGFTDDDIYLMAQLLCGDKATDGDGEYDIDFASTINYYEVNKVLCVVMNRVQATCFPNTVREVVLARNQFSVMPRNSYKTPSKIALDTVRNWCQAYDEYNYCIQTTPENHLYFTGNGSINITRPSY